jgi:alpha-ketoglutarate-dependent 2,4-dichlorophenoxyacetate dioxygenase
MSVSVQPIDPNRTDFAGRVSGVNIAANISPAIAAALESAMDHYAVLVFHDQQISDEQQYQFSKRFGAMESATGDIARSGERRLSMKMNDISNLDQRGALMSRDDRRRLFGLGNMLWHADSSFKTTPAKYSLLSAREIPDKGGNTEFADMRKAWDTLDVERQRKSMHLVCEHSQLYSRGLLGFTDWNEEERQKNAPVKQRLVRRHAGSGRLSLYLASHAGSIDGWPVPEARMFLRDLTEHATQREFVYSHQWQCHDLVMWDNRAVMHRARDYDATQVRDMRRTTVTDVSSTLDQPL